MGTTQILKTYLDFKALNDTKIPVHKHGVPWNLLCLLLSEVSSQVMMAHNCTLAVVSHKILRKAGNGNYHSSPPLTAQLPEFKGISLMV